MNIIRTFPQRKNQGTFFILKKRLRETFLHLPLVARLLKLLPSVDTIESIESVCNIRRVFELRLLFFSYSSYLFYFILFYFFFSIRVFFHGHWQLTGQQGKGGNLSLFHSTTSTRTRTFRHLCATLHVR